MNGHPLLFWLKVGGSRGIHLLFPPCRLCLPSLKTSVCTMAAVKDIYEKNKLSAAVQDWLSANGVSEVVGLAHMAPSEEMLAKNVFEMINASDGAKLTLGDRIALSKSWTMARELMLDMKSRTDKERGAKEHPKEGAALPEATGKDLNKKWFSLHGFKLPDAFMLVSPIQNELHRVIHPVDSDTKPAIKVLLLEELRTMDRMSKQKTLVMQVTPGRPLETGEVMLDEINSAVEVYRRARAFFHTCAYICIPKPEFFDLQTAMAVSEQVLSFVTLTYEGVPPLLRALITAWAMTIHYMGEQVRVANRSLKEVCLAAGEWHHMWKFGGSESSEARGTKRRGEDSRAGYGGPDVHPDISRDISAMQRTMTRLQSDRDRMQKDLHTVRARGNHGGDGGGSSSSWQSGGKMRPDPSSKRQQKLAATASKGKGKNGKGGK